MVIPFNPPGDDYSLECLNHNGYSECELFGCDYCTLMNYEVVATGEMQVLTVCVKCGPEFVWTPKEDRSAFDCVEKVIGTDYCPAG